jgi:hypothetical protein
VEALARRHGVPLCRLGTTGGDRLVIAPHVDQPLTAVLGTHVTALEAALRG